MTRALRRRHRRIFSGLAVALPAAVALALVSRPVERRGAHLAAPSPAEPIAPVPARRVPSWQGTLSGDGLRASVRLEPAGAAGSSDPGAGRVIEIEARSDVGQPELLAYWSATLPGAGSGGLPAGSTLLGTVGFHAPRRFALPSAGSGAIVLFDLARSRVAGGLAVPAADAPHAAGGTAPSGVASAAPGRTR